MDNEGEPAEYRPFRRSSTLDDFAAARDRMPPAGQASEAPHQAAIERGSALKHFVLAGLVGVVLIIVGVMLGVVTYDQRFIYDSSNPAWEVAATIGLFVVLIGIVLVPVSIVGALVVAIVRAIRQAGR